MFSLLVTRGLPEILCEPKKDKFEVDRKWRMWHAYQGDNLKILEVVKLCLWREAVSLPIEVPLHL